MQRVIERILNLLAFLLTAGHPVTADEIRHTVAGYDEKGDEAFRRTFERDKELLRDLGIPLRMAATDHWEVESGYVVRPEEYALPDPGLTEEERAALWLAARVAPLGGESASPTAIFKLGGMSPVAAAEPFAADLGADGATLGRLFGAIVERRTVGFVYRGMARTVAPLGLVHRRGHWYLVGRMGSENRTFRVDRMGDVEVGDRSGAFTRPGRFRAGAGFPDAPWEAGEEAVPAVVRFDHSVAWWARRQLAADTPVVEHPDGSLTATIPVASPEALLGWLIGFEDGAVIESPPDLRARMVAHLEASR